MPLPDYRLYIDEVGNHDQKPGMKESERYLSLTGVMVELDYVAKVIQPALEGLKVRYFDSDPDEPLIFHRKPLAHKLAPYDCLKNPEIEEWEFLFPVHDTAQRVRPNDDFGASWRGIELPYARLHNGFDPRFVEVLKTAGVSAEILQSVFEKNQFGAQIFFDAMPVQDAINFAAYVLKTTIAFAEFEIGPTACGGPLQIAAITHESGFKWINEPRLEYKEH